MDKKLCLDFDLGLGESEQYEPDLTLTLKLCDKKRKSQAWLFYHLLDSD